MSIKKLVSVDNVIINLIDALGLDHTKHKAMLVNWAVRAEKKISNYYQYQRKRTVLTIVGCIAELPEDAAHLELALLGDYGCDCGDLFTQVCGQLGNVAVTSGSIDSTSFFVVDLPAQTTTNSGMYTFGFINHVVQDNKLVFNANYNGQSVTVQYRGLALDENGIPEVNENHLEAIEEYCMWKFRRRNPKSGIDIGIYRDHKREFEELAACARAEDNEMTSSERMNTVNTLSDPWAGRGLPLTPNYGFGAY